jgi:hypothetical protein
MEVSENLATATFVPLVDGSALAAGIPSTIRIE